MCVDSDTKFSRLSQEYTHGLHYHGRSTRIELSVYTAVPGVHGTAVWAEMSSYLLNLQERNRGGRSAVVTSNHALHGGGSPCHLASREFSENGLFDPSYKRKETRIPS